MRLNVRFPPIADTRQNAFARRMARGGTDFSLSLEQLTGLKKGDPEGAPTPMVAAIRR